MDRQCSSCGGFCKKSGCERENVKLAPQRHDTPAKAVEWVGLTDEEYFALQMKIKKPMTTVQDYIDAMRMIEQALKEKNT